MIHHGDARVVMAGMEAGSVQVVVTSPPYWGLRDYGLPPLVWGGGDHEHTWEDRTKRSGGAYAQGSKKRWQHGAEDFTRDDRFLDGHPEIPAGATCGCGVWLGSLGLEPTPEVYVEHLVEVFRDVWRVLRGDGTLWLNLGDSYNTYAANRGEVRSISKNHHAEGGMPDITRGAGLNAPGLKAKDLVGIPWRVAFALQADGWYLRSDIIWAKPNPMPESVTDRPTKAHEYLFLLAKAERYYYNAEEVREPARRGNEARWDNGRNGLHSGESHAGQGSSTRKFSSKPYTSGNSERRIDAPGRLNTHMGSSVPWTDTGIGRNRRSVWTIATQPYPEAHFATFPEDLVKPCVLAGSKPGDTVLDPFCGSGTVVKVAQDLGRVGVGIELNPAYVALAEKRTRQLGLVQ